MDKIIVSISAVSYADSRYLKIIKKSIKKKRRLFAGVADPPIPIDPRIIFSPINYFSEGFCVALQ